jgi:hypothetical protein
MSRDAPHVPDTAVATIESSGSKGEPMAVTASVRGAWSSVSFAVGDEKSAGLEDSQVDLGLFDRPFARVYFGAPVA